MPHLKTRDGVTLYAEETGSGTPIVFAHEFGGDLRSWEPQLRYFSRRHRCIAFNARGYPPSDVPAARLYSQRRAVDDIADVMRGLGIRKAHIVGCSMGAYAAVNFGLRYAQRSLSLTAVAIGSGSNPAKREKFIETTLANAERFERLGMPAAVHGLPVGPARVPHRNKDPRGFLDYQRHHAEHSASGLAGTLRGVMARRQGVYELESKLRRLKIPLFVVAGDEDDGCLAPSMFVKKTCLASRLWVCPATGHAVNAEEPDLFNRMLSEFLTLVESGRWKPRDPRSIAS